MWPVNVVLPAPRSPVSHRQKGEAPAPNEAWDKTLATRAPKAARASVETDSEMRIELDVIGSSANARLTLLTTKKHVWGHCLLPTCYRREGRIARIATEEIHRIMTGGPEK